MKKIAVIGTGNLGTAIIEGLIKNKTFTPNQIFATRNNLNKIQLLEEKGVTITSDNSHAIQESDYILLCVKPFKVEEVLNKYKSYFTPNKILISVATGITINKYEEILSKDISIYRAMPNTGAAVEESITCICGNTTNEENKKTVETIFNSIGETVFINEELMNAATVIGACGIAVLLEQ